MIQRWFLPQLVAIVVCGIFLHASAAAEPARPNIVLLISDDDDYEHFGFMGNPLAHTPTLDHLATSGTLFTTAHVPAPLCRPSLASLLSGRLSHQHGIYANYLEEQGIGNDHTKLDPTGSLPNRLKSAGYATYATAKYWEGDPSEMGFTHGTIDTTFPGFSGLVRQGQEELFQFIDEQHERTPMFIWWAPLLPHTPHNPPPKYAGRFQETEIPIPPYYQGEQERYVKAARKFYAMGAWFDDGVAQLVQKLEDVGEYENTLFLFYVDNGWTLGMPAKSSPTEKGLRTPMFVTWPGHVPEGKRIDGLNYALDLHATALDYAGLEVPADIASQSLRPLIEGKADSSREALYGAVHAHAPANYKGDPSIPRGPERDVYAIYVRTERWKYILYTQDVGPHNDRYIWMVHQLCDTFTRSRGEENLFDLTTDPYEMHDLANQPEHRQTLAELRRQALDWWHRTGGGPLAVESTLKTVAARAAVEPKPVPARAKFGNEVTLESLLDEMVDRDRVARFPSSDFRLRQASSYDRDSKTPDDPDGWFANRDNTKNFVRIEEKAGRREWVIMEHDAPGAIVRSWMPDKRISSDGKTPVDTTIRVYLDGKEEPVFEGHALDLFNGTSKIPYPLAHKSLASAVSFFPIPYAKSCKITLDEPPFFYIFTYREYDEKTPIRTFTQDDFEAARPLIERVGKTLLGPTNAVASPTGNTNDNERVLMDARIAPRTEVSADLPAGEAAVRTLSLKLDADAAPQVTRSLVLKMQFDGKPTVWCPVGDFFGTGVGIHPFEGWWRTVGRDGTMTCRWVMPYHDSGKITLLNLHGRPVPVRLEAVVGDWTWDARSLYFHADWRHQYPVITRPFSDFNYVTLTGRGVYVGDTLTVMDPLSTWWGEGDAKIWVDGETFPSIFGTGTEDYYGYSWGGRHTNFYEHPFHAQPRAHRYDKFNPKENPGERNSLGYSTETRSRALDTMPFDKSLQVDMEVWHWKECQMSYAVASYWYGDTETATNREPTPEEAARPIIQPPPEKPPVPVRHFEGAVECETMEIVAKSRAISAAPQPLHRHGGHRWSGADHLFVRGEKIGDFVEVRFPVKKDEPVDEDESAKENESAEGDGPFKLTLHATQSFDYGVLQLTVNGQPAVAEIDTYAIKAGPLGPIELGVFTPIDGTFTLRAEVVGKNPQSQKTGTFFGLDCIVVQPQ